MSDELDDLIRQRLQSAIPRHADASNALKVARPAMANARRTRQIQAGLASAALVATFGLGSVLTVLRTSESDGTIVADAPEVPGESDDSGTDVVRPPTTAGESDTTGQAGDPAVQESQTAGLSPDETTTPDPPVTTGPPPTSNSEDSSTITTGENRTSTSGNTSSSNDPEPPPTEERTRTLRSDCGTVEVLVTDRSVELLSLNPQPGFETETKNDGTESVEVSFENSTTECEIRAEFEDGELKVEISNG